jgi:ADP-glucose pyrophosphorylase
MNTQLVNSLVQIIESLTEEERQLLNSHLDRNKNWQAAKLSLTQLHAQIAARQGGQPLDLSTEAIVEQIHQMREERTQQIMDACFSAMQDE